MGMFIYGAAPMRLGVEDRTLAHLEIVITTKLRRNETFAFRWERSVESGTGRGSFIIGSGIPIAFEYEGGRFPAIDNKWLETLMASANSSQGLQIVPEKPPEGQPIRPETVTIPTKGLAGGH